MIRFAGYAAIFDRPDKGGDIIRKGAFARAVETQLKLPLPLLHQHDVTKEIGCVEHLSEDARGLRMIARVTGDIPIQPGTGLSFGYRIRSMNKRTYRELTDVDLIEVSVVTHPMQPLARVLATESNTGE